MHKRSHQERASWRGKVGRWIIVAALCARAHAQQTDTQRILENEQIKEVSAAFDRGLYERVAKACDYVIAQGAQAPEWHVYLVRSLVANGMAEEAIKMAERAARLHGNELPLLLLRQQTLEGYGRKDEAQTALKAINEVARKISPKDRKAADLVALGQAALAAGADPAKVLQQYLTPAKRKDVKLEAAAAELEVSDPAKAKAIRESALFYARQRTTDLLTQMAVSVQGYLALDLVKKNNIELVKGVDRASTTTVAALRTAVTVAQALTNQRLVLDQITALNTTTANMIDSTGAMLKNQTGDIHKQAASSTIPLETLQRAFQNIYETMDTIDRFKVEALGNMKQTVETLSSEVEKSRGYIARAEGVEQNRLAAPAESPFTALEG